MPQLMLCSTLLCNSVHWDCYEPFSALSIEADFFTESSCTIKKKEVNNFKHISAMIKIISAFVVITSIGLINSQEIFEITTRLDDPRFRFLFHGFRDFIFNTIGKTGQKTEGKFLQQKFPANAPFPCDISLGRSKVRPNSIHKLRVGGKALFCHNF